MSHPAKVYYSLDQLIKERSHNHPKSLRFLIRVWKRHFERNGNRPLIIKCAICSGKKRLKDIKHGNFKISTRVSLRQKEEEIEA